MEKSIREHIQRIRTTIAHLEEQQGRVSDEVEKLKTETDLRSLRLALMHYELALEIEREVIEGRSQRSADTQQRNKFDG